MTSKQIIQKILEDEYEDKCDHPRVTLVIPDTGGYDCEGAQFGIRCLSCHQMIQEGSVYE